MCFMKKIVIANWKMNPGTLAEAQALAAASGKSVPRGVKLVLCPPTLFFVPLFAGSKGKKYSLGVQNIFYERSGAYTGEISAKMAYEAGARFAIVGHSERRRLGESDSEISKKVLSALKERITPILCVGEKERDHGGAYLSVLKEQVRNSLANVSKSGVKKIIVAYEPIWAIGKSAKKAMNADILHQTAILIRKILVDRFGSAGRGVKIIYGGSVAPENAMEIVRRGEVNGLLVGHQSLKPDSFSKILKEVAKA